MGTHTRATYPPLDTLKPVARDIWVVDGPVIRFGMPWPTMPFPTRMTVIRLAGGLFIHSPTPLLPTLTTEIVATGPPRWIVGPNRIHYWWIPHWHAAFPEREIPLEREVIVAYYAPFAELPRPATLEPRPHDEVAHRMGRSRDSTRKAIERVNQKIRVARDAPAIATGRDVSAEVGRWLARSGALDPDLVQAD